MGRRQFAHVRLVAVHIKQRNPFRIGGVGIQRVGAHGAVFFVKTVVVVVLHHIRLRGPFLHKDVVVEAVVPVQDGHKAHDFGAVGEMIRGIA